LIYVLVIAGQAAAAGIVVAAKSILRYPEISSHPQRIAPEYVLHLRRHFICQWRFGDSLQVKLSPQTIFVKIHGFTAIAIECEV
jgi:hypothetical protein